MLEKYNYINYSCSERDIPQKIELLFLSNNQAKRYEHICAVIKRIDMIAVQYGLDREKCRFSAMFHDISTLIKWEDMLPYAKDSGWELCDAEISHPFLLHQRISEVITREDFGITDCDVLGAIAFHTSLCENASQYQMALFIADKLEWSAEGYPPYYEKMSAALNKSLEAACYEYVKYTESAGKMESIHSDWAKGVRWLKSMHLSEITDERIDGGKAFDWGKTSVDYAKYRDIYPQMFYDKIIDRNLCIKGQKVLDIGTGTGVIPRNMYRYGAKWIGTDISENQIQQAKILSKDLDITYYTSSTEALDFPADSFDVVTACQCFFYFDHERIMPILHRMLKADGRILILYMAWLPLEDKIAGESEKLVLKYNPNWSGAGEVKHPIYVPECYNENFELVYSEEYELSVPFTRESWNGRIKACRGIGASLTRDEIVNWEREHMALLEKIAPDKFDILHYAAIAELRRK